MCGIAGYFGSNILDNKKIEMVINALHHRGPDANGVYVKKILNKSLTLIHTRLKILDLKSRSNQPFKFNKSCLIYNGEIYNFIELRAELEKLGHKFITSSDTEVLVHSIKQWGIEKSLEKFEGMWAFAYFDEINNQLILARDRFGEKPLYFYRDIHGFYFSSEIKGIASLKGEWPEKNFRQLLKYLNNGYRSLHKTTDTFYKNVYEFPKGHFMVLNYDGSYKKKSYWNIPKIKKNNLTIEENSENIKSLLIKSLKIRTRSDVPVAYCLSSGIDSNALINISKKILNIKVNAFSINSKDERYSEKNLILKTLQQEKINCYFVENTDKNFLNKIKKLIKSHDSPISTISYYAQSILYEKIKEKGFKVAISGTGADELFTGYYDHHNLYLSHIKKNKRLFKNSLIFWKKHQKQMIRNKNLLDPYLFINDPSFRKYLYQDNKKFKNFFYKEYYDRFTEIKFTKNILRNRMLNELFYEIVPPILHEDDLNSMANSIENRSPFLDKDLFEYSLSIPTSQLIQNGYGKFILRKSLEGIVPNKILKQRRKIGFNLSISELINFKNKKNLEFILDKSDIFEIISKKEIEKFVKKKSFLNSESKFLFNFLNAKLFLEN